MIVNITPGFVKGNIQAPPSKSITHRALFCSALSKGISEIHSPLISDDTRATQRVLTQLGAEIVRKKDYWKILGGNLNTSSSDLFCGESGTTLRLLTPVCALTEGESKLKGGSSLSRRPIEELLVGLRLLGVECKSSNGYPPVTIFGKGMIPGGKAVIRGDISSQFVSAILLIAPLTEKDTKLSLTTCLESKPYVKMTIETIKEYGININASEDMTHYHVERQEYKPTKIKIEGDWSSSSYLLAAGAINGDVTVFNIRKESHQADTVIIKILERMGSKVNFKNNTLRIQEAGLEAIDTDLRNAPDLFPIVASLCACAKGESYIQGLARLRYKESDRISAMVEGLRRMDIKVIQKDNHVIIEGGKPKGAIINPYNDHRIAMSLAILSLSAKGNTTILDAECVSKSYPSFWKVLEEMGINLRRMNDGQ